MRVGEKEVDDGSWTSLDERLPSFLGGRKQVLGQNADDGANDEYGPKDTEYKSVRYVIALTLSLSFVCVCICIFLIRTGIEGK